MKKYFENLAKALLGMNYSELDQAERNVIDSIANNRPIATDINHSFDEQLTLGQRTADRVAEFGGSWPFIIIFVVVMILWIVLNTVWIIEKEAFDPYPFILLNLILSTLAALQAPIIMMSQNRQAAKDRMATRLNYEVSLKTDLEIMQLQKKVDELRSLVEKRLNNENK
ncbi:DUF1003 domain-containing protein [Paraneptunicella aestuarii]|uniref:DUF1003 domain-containing protein n=1 Tax=Paraneptunicella aestuarii TaxID=2831148 RepID=UPI001E40F5D9|nr:DUF1003 domain-containing protein [Paraneptunicella aestuarii]UAA40163.1 DUF1003 domain-containing protein [Paraneptunicella aestuarii]